MKARQRLGKGRGAGSSGKGRGERREIERERNREGVCGKLGDWKRGSPRESAVLGMNRVRRCEFISVRRIPTDPTPGADGQEQKQWIEWKFIKMHSG